VSLFDPALDDDAEGGANCVFALLASPVAESPDLEFGE
jgi:hypothetical protein